MIDPALLDRLRNVDPVAYERYQNDIIMEVGSLFSKCSQVIRAYQLLNHAKESWLQHVIQDAIEARGFHLSQSQDPDSGKYYADISEISPGYDGDHWNEKHLWLISEEEDDSRIGALLRTYLAAIEAQP